MYLPKFKQTDALYTAGEEFIIASTGAPYVGFYIKTSKGTLYTGIKFNKNTSEVLEKASEIATSNYRYVGREKYDDAARVTEDNLKLKDTQVVPSHTYIPNYEVKINRRFFAKSKINSSIIEIDINTYRELYGKTATYHHPTYDILFIDWDLSSPVEDSKNGSYIIEGSKSKNRKQVLKADKTFKGIYDYLVQNQQL